MTGAEIEEALKTLTIVVDTREQMTPKAVKRFESFGYPYERQKLDFGDYSAFVTLDDGAEVSLVNKINIERKMSIDELAMCFGRERGRFEREFERMKAAGGHLYLLTEGFTWEKIERHQYRSRMNPASLLASMTAWMARYRIQFIQCTASTSGWLIGEILKREIKEVLTDYEPDND